MTSSSNPKPFISSTNSLGFESDIYWETMNDLAKKYSRKKPRKPSATLQPPTGVREATTKAMQP